MEKRLNKKGQDLSIGTLILIVLGIVVLVLLILGFSLGWDNLWEKINIFGGGSSIGDISTQCGLYVSQGSASLYNYCYDFKQVKIDNKKEYVNCQDDRVKAGFQGGLDCDSNEVKKAKETLCTNLKKQGEGDVKVNNVACLSIIPKNCVPNEDECQVIDIEEDSEDCKDACEITMKTGDETSVDSCELVEDAEEECEVQNLDKDECDKLIGCEWIGED